MVTCSPARVSAWSAFVIGWVVPAGRTSRRIVPVVISPSASETTILISLRPGRLATA